MLLDNHGGNIFLYQVMVEKTATKKVDHQQNSSENVFIDVLNLVLVIELVILLL
jgi:hypothetical protein